MTTVSNSSLYEALLDRREHLALTAADRKWLTGQRVLITGAGGSVGAELVRAVADCSPDMLALVEHSEAQLFRIDRELRQRWPTIEVAPLLCDVTRERDIRRALTTTRPDVVYHTAAYKHIMTAERGVLTAVRANVFGTWHTARAAAAIGSRFVLASTDKAASPTSVVGATKRFAELVALLAETPPAPSVAVRFGHVLGSSGSLLELLLEQLRRGEPLTLTDPAAARYVITPHEAAALVIKSDLLGSTGAVYWLDLAAPVRILDIAERLLEWGETKGFARVPIRYVGLRPGEKLCEALDGSDLAPLPSRHPGIRMAKQVARDYAVVRRVMRALVADLRRGDPLTALADLHAGVPEYEPSHYARTHSMRESLAHVHIQGDAPARAARA